MRCPSCKSSKNKVIDSRLTESGEAVRRRRVCLDCGRRFTTKERIEDELRLSVVKTDGTRVPYQREKVLRGAERACYKLNVTDMQLQGLADRVEEELLRNHDREVTSEQIGLYVGQQLRRLNQVAYVRFMSVYRKYNNVEEFVEEIRDVKELVAQEIPSQQSLFES
jgi:transcriptional repressor NrdR